MQLSPLDAGAYDAYAGMAYPLFFTGRHEEALTWIDKALGERPLYGPALWLRPAAAVMAGRPQEEIEESLRRLRVIQPDLSIQVNRRGHTPMRPEDRAMIEDALRKAGAPD